MKGGAGVGKLGKQWGLQRPSQKTKKQGWEEGAHEKNISSRQTKNTKINENN